MYPPFHLPLSWSIFLAATRGQLALFILPASSLKLTERFAVYARRRARSPFQLAAGICALVFVDLAYLADNICSLPVLARFIVNYGKSARNHLFLFCGLLPYLLMCN